MAVLGENIVPLGRAGTGAAVVLGNDLSPLRILQQGDAMRARRAAQEAALKQKRDAEAAKMLQDAKYTQDSSVYFGDALHNQVYAGIEGKLGKIAMDQGLDSIGKSLAYRSTISPIENENAQNKAKSAFLQDRSNEFQKNQELYNNEFIYTNLVNKLRDETGRPLRPSEFDADAWHRDIIANPEAYNELGVINQATKNLFPVTSQKVTRAGRLGGTHETFEVKGRLVSYDGEGRLLRNGDKTPKLNITSDDVNALKSEPLFNLKLEQRKAQYAAKRAADPSLPAMSELGHISMMLAPLAKYDTQHEEALNAQPRAERAGPREKNPPIYSAPVEADYVAPGEVENPGTQDGAAPLPFGLNPTGADTFRTLQAAQVPKGPQQVLATSKYSVPAPVHATASGQNKPYQTDVNGVSFRQALVQGEDGKYHWRTNIDKPTVGSFGDAVALPVNKATGVPLTPADGAAYEAAVRDPQNEVRSFVQVITPKGKNFSSLYTGRLTQLKAERARQQGGDILGKGRYSTDAELEDQARQDATGETTISYVPNYGQDARTLDGLTQSGPKGNYRAHREGVAGHQQRVRAATGAAPTGPLAQRMSQRATPAPTTTKKKAW